HLGLHGNFFGGEAERIAGAVELFVMRASNFRDEAEIAGPGNLHEEVEAVNDVGFDEAALGGVEAAARNGKEADFVGGEVRALVATGIAVGLADNIGE